MLESHYEYTIVYITFYKHVKIETNKMKTKT